ncbi:acyl-CoA thioesterase [Mucilaginibacter sp. KACC 22063]|uniref:acyl-CoA thioesterase n=1 Tax=Mucilaginibacter sp. KACC 22063 TaxID=3025666 RepID=UPI002366F0BB|nr:acyl-CoA thioesterase [Mucilaginibacter sp. KACC 22063]WDF57148.1 acyl-CoA thioesterase [Mucilaginibacter sp. KACC 22063]
MSEKQYASFETEHRVRPDDIDMFQHVHSSKYMDYVMAARYEQMEVHYGMPMEKFMEQGFGWVVRAVHLNYKRALLLGDYFLVRTGIKTIDEKGCRVHFTITNKTTKKICCDGWFDYTMIDIKTGRALRIPADIVEHYENAI